MSLRRRQGIAGLALAAAAVLAFALAPLVHGLVHGDHQVEALAQIHAANAAFGTQQGAPNDGQACDLYRLCLAPGGLAPPNGDVAPPIAAITVDTGTPRPETPALAPRQLPRARAPPAIVA